MELLELVANINLALIDLVALEVILVSIFYIDERNNIKYTFEFLFKNLSPSKKTEVYVIWFLILGVTYFFFSNYYQDKLILWMINSFGWCLIISAISLLFFTIAWVSKFIVGREWNFRLVIWPIILFFITFFIFILCIAK